MPDSTRSDTHLPPDAKADGGTRSGAGSNYGDFVPAPRLRPDLADSSRGAELERDASPADTRHTGHLPDPKADTA